MKTTQKIVISSMFAALVCVATMLIKIPSPLKGYLNLGDCVVLVAAWMLPIGYNFLAAGIGSALADIFLGYIVYAPATFFIKGAMAVIAYGSFLLLSKRSKILLSRIVSGILAEITMILGYFLFEGFLYGFSPSLVNIPANGVQGIAGLIIGTILITVFEKQNLTKIFKLQGEQK
ncbi:MAG: ECF transporter S component [Clostridia bacterium]|nr:ECF transporter S component [Clostridia bacterium]